MMKSSVDQAEQNKTHSLRDCLLVIIQNTNCSFEIVALAAEAIAADARFNDWFLNFAKKSLCEEKLLELLECNEYEEITSVKNNVNKTRLCCKKIGECNVCD